MSTAGGILSRLWAVAKGPNRAHILVIDSEEHLLCEIGESIDGGESLPRDVGARFARALDTLIEEARTNGQQEVAHFVDVEPDGARLHLRAIRMMADPTETQRFVLRVERDDGDRGEDRNSGIGIVDGGTDGLTWKDLVLQQVAENSDAGFWISNEHGHRFRYMSPKCEEILGLTRAQLEESPQRWFQIIVPEDQAPLTAAIAERGVDNIDVEYRIVKPNGDIAWIRSKTFPLLDANRKRACIAGFVTDVSARRAAELALADHAHRDSLTQVMNRRGLARKLSDFRSRGIRGSAILLDCDNFQDINDKFGHGAGDVVLRQVADRIQQMLRPGDVLGRVGGDEFVALLPHTLVNEAAEVAERIRVQVARTHLRMGETYVAVSASFGVAPIEDEVVVDQLVHRAEQAVRTSKRLGKNRVHTDVNPFVRDAESIRASLLRGTGLRVVSQKIRRLDTEEVAAAELLTRRDADDRLRDPTDFFAFAAEQNIVTSVDISCLRACLEYARKECPNLDVHVNVFPSTLLELSTDSLASVFGVADLRRFHVEIVEEQFIADPEYLLESVRELRRLGAKVVLDDVGFGQSSLEAMVLLEPDEVKLDRRVVKGVGSSATKQKNIERIFAIVKAVGAIAVAEGIEVREDLDYLRSIGVPLGQGYYWDTPK